MATVGMRLWRCELSEMWLPSLKGVVGGRRTPQRLLHALLLFSCLALQVLAQNRKAYIAVLKEGMYPSGNEIDGSLRKRQAGGPDLIAKHDSILASVVTKSSEKSPRKLYSYFTALNAFSALLTETQAEQLRRNSEIAHISPTFMMKKLTTHSYTFLGLDTTNSRAWSRTNGTNTIIGIIDDGIWPESASFSPGNLGPVPSKFKGTCQTGQNFTKKHCNRKIVGARYFAKAFLSEQGISKFPPGYSDYISPRSAYGHGVHVSGIASGNVVTGVSVGGFRFGTAKGVAFSSRISVYKVCWGIGGCSNADVVAGIDQAVRDGVDVISMSLGYTGTDFFSDLISQAFLGAALAGVPGVTPAGNDDGHSTVQNNYPWVLTVAYSSIDRVFHNSVRLGNRKIISGVGITNGLAKNRSYPLVFGYDEFFPNSEYCSTLNPKTVKNKIVYCRGTDAAFVSSQVDAVYNAGGVGVIVSKIGNSFGYEKLPEIGFFSLPTSQISSSDGDIVEEYARNAKSPTATITAFNTLYGSKYIEAPTMSPYSSPGPNPVTQQILKPDITAPGISILSAWTENSQSPVLPFSKTAKFKFDSGSSMACPHVSGAIALLKSFHPKWPVSWLYSAVMTTAYTKTNRNNPILLSTENASPVNYGSGHLDVDKALYPGLVYAWASQDITKFLCLTKSSTSTACSNAIQEYELNLPSLSLPSLCATTTVKRRLTNADNAPSNYSVTVSSPAGTTVTVTPKTLTFLKLGHTREYRITVKPITPYDQLTLDYASYGFTYGVITWANKKNRRVKLTVAASVPSNC